MTLNLPDEAAYRQYYIQNFTGRPLWFQTSMGAVPVYFGRDKFDHAFFESSRRDGNKDQFSLTRAMRMEDIGRALLAPSEDRRAGWDKKLKRYDHTHCVSIAMQEFVIIVRLGLTSKGYLRGNFVTCYVADNSIGKIRNAPKWNESECVTKLAEKRNGR